MVLGLTNTFPMPWSGVDFHHPKVRAAAGTMMMVTGRGSLLMLAEILTHVISRGVGGSVASRSWNWHSWALSSPYTQQ